MIHEEIIEHAAASLYERDHADEGVAVLTPWESLSEADKQVWRKAVSA